MLICCLHAASVVSEQSLCEHDCSLSGMCSPLNVTVWVVVLYLGLLLHIFRFPLIEQHAISATMTLKQVVVETRNDVISLCLEWNTESNSLILIVATSYAVLNLRSSYVLSLS
jgi:hypothetical protein